MAAHTWHHFSKHCQNVEYYHVNVTLCHFDSWLSVASSGDPSDRRKLSGLIKDKMNFEALARCVQSKQPWAQELRSRLRSTARDAFYRLHCKAWANPSGERCENILLPIFAYCGETSAWSGTCAKFNPRNLAPLKRHARLWSASFGWHVLQCKSYTRPSYAPKNTGAKSESVASAGAKIFCAKTSKSQSLGHSPARNLRTADGCKRLQTVANGCKRLQTVANTKAASSEYRHTLRRNCRRRTKERRTMHTF